MIRKICFFAALLAWGAPAFAANPTPEFGSETLDAPLAVSSGGTGLNALGAGVPAALGNAAGAAGGFALFNSAAFSINRGGVGGNTGVFYLNSQIAPVGGANLTQGFLIQTNAYGQTGPNSPFYNQIAVADALDASIPGGAYWLYVSGNVGGPTAKGGRVALTGSITVNATTGNINGANTYYVGMGANASAAVNDNGTSSAPSGSLFGSSGSALLSSGATYWAEAVGREDDVGVMSGASTTVKSGHKIVLLAGDSVQGSGVDDALVLAAQDWLTPGWKTGLSFGDATGYWAIAATGTMIGTQAQIGGTGHTKSYLAATGIDFSAVAFSSYFLKSTGFTVDGSGNVTAASYKSGAAAGVSCAAGAVNLTTFTVTNGIVTHC